MEVLTEDDSTDLLLQLTATRRRPTPDAPSQARELSKLLDGLPLAIQQAAGYINEQRLTFAAYLTRYQEEAADLLNWFSDLRISYERPEKTVPRPVLITLKTSFDKLRTKDKLWLLVFCHFAPDPIPEFLLEPTQNATPQQKFVLREPNAAVAQLEKYSLITRSSTEPAFKVHRLVQQIILFHAPTERRLSALKNAVTLIQLAELGESLDVRNWARWNWRGSHEGSHWAK